MKTRYQYTVYHPPTYMETETGGKQPITFGHYETKWSDLYSLSIKFYSGQELNEFYASTAYTDSAIYAFITWSNGGTSFVTIDGWTTDKKNVDEAEIKYDTSGNKITMMPGTDSNGQYWEIYF